MDSQAVLAYIGAVDEAALHHPPADQALQSPEQEQRDEVWRIAARNPFR